MTSYDLPQQWAAAFHEAGFAGLVHELRHDPRPLASGVSVFGRDGARRGPGRIQERRDLEEADIRSAKVKVFDPPSSSQIPFTR